MWGINGSGVYRYNYCTSLFDNAPFSGSMTRISTGGGDFWGLDSNANIFEYDFQVQGWIQIGGSLRQIAVGVNDAWGLDGSGHAYRYDHSAGFVQVDGSAVFTQIAAGGNGVWAIMHRPKLSSASMPT